jgi:hypothetical protein
VQSCVRGCIVACDSDCANVDDVFFTAAVVQEKEKLQEERKQLNKLV